MIELTLASVCQIGHPSNGRKFLQDVKERCSLSSRGTSFKVQEILGRDENMRRFETIAEELALPACLSGRQVARCQTGRSGWGVCFLVAGNRVFELNTKLV